MKRLKEMLDMLPHDNRAASGPNILPNTSKGPNDKDKAARNITRNREVARPTAMSKAQALAGKQPEFNRGKGSQRNPFTPKQTITAPNEAPSVTKKPAISQASLREADELFEASPEYIKWKEGMVAQHGDNLQYKNGRTGSGKAWNYTTFAHKDGKPVGSFIHSHINAVLAGKHGEAARQKMASWIKESTMKKSFKQIREARRVVVNTHHTPNGKIVVVHHGNDFTAVLHPEHVKAIRELPVGGSHRFKDEQGVHWNAHKTDNYIHLRNIHSTSNETSFLSHHLDEGRDSEYNANIQLSSTKGGRKPGHYLMRHGVPLHNEPHATSNAALSAYHNLADKSNVKIQHVKEDFNPPGFMLGDKVAVIKQDHPRYGQEGTLQGVDHAGNCHVSFNNGEQAPFHPKYLQKVASRNSAVGAIAGGMSEEAPAMAAGAAGDPGHVQNASDNYASQKKTLSMLRRKKPVAEAVNKTLHHGLTEVEYHKKGLTISHFGNMGNREEHVARNVDHLLGQGAFAKMRPHGVFHKDKYNTHNDPSYSYILHVPKEHAL